MGGRGGEGGENVVVITGAVVVVVVVFVVVVVVVVVHNSSQMSGQTSARYVLSAAQHAPCMSPLSAGTASPKLETSDMLACVSLKKMCTALIVALSALHRATETLLSYRLRDQRGRER